MPEVREMIEQPGVQIVEGHLCAYEPGVLELEKRPRGWMTNCLCLACPGGVPTRAGRRTAECTFTFLARTEQ